MVNRIRAYIEHEFEGIPQTKKVLELKEELLANLIEKYNDYLKNGKTEEEAYTAVISGIGDIYELIEELKEPYLFIPPNFQKEKRKRALINAIAIAIFIISTVVVPFWTINFGNPINGVFVMIALIAIASGLLIYNVMTRIKYIKTDDSLVEDFKAYRKKNSRQREAFRSFKSALWTLTVAIYLAVSFIYKIWQYSWILFIIAIAVEEIVKGILILRSEKDEQ